MLNKYIKSESKTREWIKHFQLCCLNYKSDICPKVATEFIVFLSWSASSFSSHAREMYDFSNLSFFWLLSSPPGWLLPCVKTWKSPLTVHFHSSIFINSILGKVAWCFSPPLLEDPWGDPLHPPEASYQVDRKSRQQWDKWRNCMNCNLLRGLFFFSKGLKNRGKFTTTKLLSPGSDGRIQQMAQTASLCSTLVSMQRWNICMEHLYVISLLCQSIFTFFLNFCYIRINDR